LNGSFLSKSIKIQRLFGDKRLRRQCPFQQLFVGEFPVIPNGQIAFRTLFRTFSASKQTLPQDYDRDQCSCCNVEVSQNGQW
jgi:hypothetical protein